MKVKDLLERIKENRRRYPDFLEWDVYTEQCDEKDKKWKRKKDGQNWEVLKDGDGWEYFKCEGFHTTFPNEKAFSVNVNY